MTEANPKSVREQLAEKISVKLADGDSGVLIASVLLEMLTELHDINERLHSIQVVLDERVAGYVGGISQFLHDELKPVVRRLTEQTKGR